MLCLYVYVYVVMGITSIPVYIHFELNWEGMCGKKSNGMV